MSEGSPVGRKRGNPCRSRLESGPDEVGKEWLEGVPLSDHWSDCQEDLLLVGVWGPGLDQGRAQVGHLGWLGEHLPDMVVEGRHRPGRVVIPGSFELAE